MACKGAREGGVRATEGRGRRQIAPRGHARTALALAPAALRLLAFLLLIAAHVAFLAQPRRGVWRQHGAEELRTWRRRSQHPRARATIVDGTRGAAEVRLEDEAWAIRLHVGGETRGCATVRHGHGARATKGRARTCALRSEQESRGAIPRPDAPGK